MNLYISNVKAWAPGISTKEEWEFWKKGGIQIRNEKVSPEIKFTDPLFRRRLSQLTKMTIQTVHDVTEERPDCLESKIVFVSFRGEIERQFAINRMLIEDNSILPAAFSLSVFNTPVAAATIALKMKGGYSVIYPSKENFKSALTAAASPVLCGEEKNIIFVYADEKIPDCYKEVFTEDAPPLSFAAVFSSEKTENSLELSTESLPCSPLDFLRLYLK